MYSTVGTGYLNEALGFKSVSATGTSGDTASLYEGAGANTYSSQRAVGTLAAGSISYTQNSFGFVNIVAGSGSSDSLNLGNLTYNLNKAGNWK